MNVELRHLRTLSAIAEEGSFGRAASRLNLSQSSVSQQVAALERSVGGPLFDRPGGPRAVRLTALGNLVLGRGSRVLRSAEELERAVERFRAGASRLDIGTLQSVSTVILPVLIARLREEHPECEVRLAEGESEAPCIGDLDMLFSDGPVDDDVESVKLVDDPYVLVARRGDLPDGAVQVKELDGRPMVAWPTTCDQPRMEHALRASGARPRVVFRSANNETLLAMVRAGLGFAVLPRLAVRSAEGDERLDVHSLVPAPTREIHLHWPRRRSLTPLARRAIALTVEIAGAS